MQYFTDLLYQKLGLLGLWRLSVSFLIDNFQNVHNEGKSEITLMEQKKFT